ncbi:MAG: endonuclease/exonuclease/phosphatase family protein [Pseudanabaena sp. RU_4_16]|nr:endonuclease/exonuclease/phosphatase family protein [Pseudanabaena sp. RU_4_16]
MLASYIAFVGIISIALLSVASQLITGSLWLELASHFKVQYLILCLLLFGILLLSQRQTTTIAISLFCLIIIATEILPWYLPQHSALAVAGTNRTVNRAVPLKVINSNILILNRNYDKVLSFVRADKPDIAIFIEVDEAWAKKLAPLKDILPYSTDLPLSFDLGIAVFSRLPLKNIAVEYFDTDSTPSQFKRASIVADLEIEGQTISLIATHPATPIKPRVFNSRNIQLEAIAKYIQTLKHPVVMAGDLNITMWSPYYRKFISDAGLHNAREGFGILPTWPTNKAQSRLVARISKLVAIPIDHCLVSPAIAVQNIRTGPNVDSDHLPLITDLLIPIKGTEIGT